MPEHQQIQQSTESKIIIKKQENPAQKTPIKQIHFSHPMAIIQRARVNPKSLTHADVMQLQRTIGNRAVGKLLSEIGLIPSKAKKAQPVQKQPIPEEEEEPLLQRKSLELIQRQEIQEPEEEPLQGKFENKPTQKTYPSYSTLPIQREKENHTGMSDNLKVGTENLSGIDMSDVRVHYNSDKPAQVGALAYTQGKDIHVASRQERHLPHEAWHVVQQAQGRVKPTIQLKDGVLVNDDKGMEQEADEMGEKSFTTGKDIFFRQGCISREVVGGQEMIANDFAHVVQQNKEAVMQLSVLQQQVSQSTTTKTSFELVGDHEVQGNKTEKNQVTSEEDRLVQLQTPVYTQGTDIQVAPVDLSKKPFIQLKPVKHPSPQEWWGTGDWYTDDRRPGIHPIMRRNPHDQNKYTVGTKMYEYNPNTEEYQSVVNEENYFDPVRHVEWLLLEPYKSGYPIFYRNRMFGYSQYIDHLYVRHDLVSDFKPGDLLYGKETDRKRIRWMLEKFITGRITADEYNKRLGITEERLVRSEEEMDEEGEMDEELTRYRQFLSENGVEGKPSSEEVMKACKAMIDFKVNEGFKIRFEVGAIDLDDTRTYTVGEFMYILEKWRANPPAQIVFYEDGIELKGMTYEQLVARIRDRMSIRERMTDN